MGIALVSSGAHLLYHQALKMKWANQLEYPYSPKAAWRLAVSRRFGVERIDELYGGVILPVLKREGLILECRFAGESTADFDFWMNRMSVLLELADIHILLDIEPTANVKWEIQRSNKIVDRAVGPTLMTQLGWAPFSARTIFHPVQVVICRGSGVDRHPRSFLRGPAKIYLRESAGRDGQERLTRMIQSAKKQRLRVLYKTIYFFENCKEVLRVPITELENILAVMTEMARLIIEDEDMDRAVDQAMEAADKMSNWIPDLDFLNNRKKWELSIINGEIQLHSYRETWDIMTEYMRVVLSQINAHDMWSPYMTLACRFIGATAALGMYRCARDARRLRQSKR